MSKSQSQVFYGLFNEPLSRQDAGDEKRVQELASSDIELTCMGELMRMLTHPVIKRSQPLTDRLLRLLAQISLHLPAPAKSVGETNPDTKNSDGQKDDSDKKE